MRRWRTGAAQLARRIAATALATCAAIARAQGPPPLRQYHHTVWPLGDAPLGDAPLGEAPLGPLARIARSPDGYLWAGSPTALVRFDGVRFTRLDGTNVAALRMTDTVTRGFAPLRVDRLGRMWVARPDGALLTYVEGVFRVVLDPGRGHVRYLDLYEDGAGGLWVAADSARHRWIRRLRGDRPVPGTWPAGVPDSGVTRGVPDTADGMWIGTRTQGLWHVTPRGARRYDPPAAVVNAGPGRSLVPELQSADGTVWVFPSSGAGLQRVRGDRWTTVLLDSDPHTMGVSSVAQAPDGSVYIAGRGYGVLRWRDGHLERRPPGDGPAGTAVFDVAVDADGTIWASTDLGLERFRPAPFMTLGRRDGVPFDVPFELSGDALHWRAGVGRRTLAFPFRLLFGPQPRTRSMTDTAAAVPATPATFAAPAPSDAVRGRLLWTDLMVPDVEVATRFYPAVTGWTLTPWVMAEGVPPYTMWTAGAAPVGGVMGMSESEAAGAPPARWLAYFGTPDVDATYRDALALGARAIVPPRDIPTVGRFAILADPQGAGFAAFQPSTGPAPRGGPPGDGEFSWLELGTTDAEAALAFYTRLFGWAPTESMAMGPGHVYQMFGSDGTSVGAIYPAAMGREEPHWLLYIRVADLTHALDAVRRGGGQVLMAPREIPGGDVVARCADPLGAAFALHAPAPRAAG